MKGFFVLLHCISVASLCTLDTYTYKPHDTTKYTTKYTIKPQDTTKYTIKPQITTKYTIKPQITTESQITTEPGLPQISNGVQTHATYYFRIGDDITQCIPVQNFNNGQTYSSCGNLYGSQSKYWVAIANGGSHCGRSILATYGQKTITLTVVDTCNACQEKNHLDMGLEALVELTGSKEVACAVNQPLPQISWVFV